MAKEFMYMGKTLQELQQMSPQEFAKIATSRTRRSINRGLDKNTSDKMMRAHQQIQSGHHLAKPIRTHLRHFVILPQMVGLKIAVYKGNTFEPIDIQPEMIGHLLGEYVLTRKRVAHGKAGIGSTKSSTAITAK